MKLNNSVKYVYNKETAKWSRYDDIFPSEIERINKEITLEPKAPLHEYVNSFYKFLIEIGFEKNDIERELAELLSTSTASKL